MRLHLGRVDHDRLLFATTTGQRFHHPGEDPMSPHRFHLLERVLGGLYTRVCIAPPQPIAIDECYPANDPPIIDPFLSMALWKKGLKPIQLLLGQPSLLAHPHPRQTMRVKREGPAASSISMGLDPNKAPIRDGHRIRTTGTLQLWIIAVVVEPMMRLRMRL